MDDKIMYAVWETVKEIVSVSEEPTIVVIIENPEITFTSEYKNTEYRFKTQLETNLVFPIYLKDTPKYIQEKFNKSCPVFFGYDAKADFSKPQYFLDGAIVENL